MAEARRLHEAAWRTDTHAMQHHLLVCFQHDWAVWPSSRPKEGLAARGNGSTLCGPSWVHGHLTGRVCS